MSHEPPNPFTECADLRLFDRDREIAELRARLNEFDGCPTVEEWRKLVQAEGEARAECERLKAEAKESKEQRDESAEETANAIEFLRTELDWSYFRAEMLYGKDDQEKKTMSGENARQLKNYLNESGHALAFMKKLDRVRATLAEREAETERLTKVIERNSPTRHLESVQKRLEEREHELSDALAEIEGLKGEIENWMKRDIAWTRDAERLEQERDEARAALATARKEALEDVDRFFAGILEGAMHHEARSVIESAREGILAIAGMPECGGNRCWKSEDGKTIHSSKSYSTCRALASDTKGDGNAD